MDTSLYISKMEEDLGESFTYKELSFKPTKAIRNDVLSPLIIFTTFAK